MKISILVKIYENLDFGEIVRILDFDQNLKRCRFWSKYKKMFILVKIIKRTLTLVKIF